MIGVFVTFHYTDNFDEQAVRKIAETSRPRFEGMLGLRSKAFTLNSQKREATNFYVWESEDAAKSPLAPGPTPGRWRPAKPGVQNSKRPNFKASSMEVS